MKILIVYISTGSYNNYFNDFYDSVQYFLPNVDKEILAISDIDHERATYNYRISHGPWPIVALLKFYYITEAIKSVNINTDITHIMYINANAKFYARPDAINDLFIKHLNEYDCLFSYHCYNPYNSCNTWLQTAFFAGKKNKMLELFKLHNKKTKNNLENFIIPKWHDETVLNDLYSSNKLSHFNVHCDHYIKKAYIRSQHYNYMKTIKNPNNSNVEMIYLTSDKYKEKFIERNNKKSQ